MKILLSTIILLLFYLPCFADQQTTVLQERAALGKVSATLPYIDGSNDVGLEKKANALIRETANKLAKEVGGSISYEVKLNRPSLVSLLLTADNGQEKAYAGLNIDLTTGQQFYVTDFFICKRKNMALMKGLCHTPNCLAICVSARQDVLCRWQE